ncbi:MAG: hypothetical protein ACXVUL_22320 [Solirubrobacteraceae bacterium]
MRGAWPEKARAALTGAVGCAAVVLLGCGSSAPTTRTASSPVPADLLAQARPIGHGERFHPPATGPVVGSCKSTLGARVGAHVELFAANRVVLIAAGIGTRPPVSYSAGRIASARCYGDLVTLEPTGVVLVRRGAMLMLSDLFRSWGQPLSEHRLASFSAGAGRRVRVFVDGRPRSGAPGAVPLSAHSEIVLEVGPHVPPHASYTFPPGS